jgi:hypothetical protein
MGEVSDVESGSSIGHPIDCVEVRPRALDLTRVSISHGLSPDGLRNTGPNQTPNQNALAAPSFLRYHAAYRGM